MRELLKENQEINIVPQNFRNANKGIIRESSEQEFTVETTYPPNGINLNSFIEFFAKTPFGVLYFESYPNKIEGSFITVPMPIKHRILQRRQFTRIDFKKDINFSCNDRLYNVSILDLSPGGLRLKSNKHLNIEEEYNAVIELNNDQSVQCAFAPIRIEKNDDSTYTLSGRFKNISNIDKMTLVQFCAKNDIEKSNL